MKTQMGVYGAKLIACPTIKLIADNGGLARQSLGPGGHALS